MHNAQLRYRLRRCYAHSGSRLTAAYFGGFARLRSRQVPPVPPSQPLLKSVGEAHHLNPALCIETNSNLPQRHQADHSPLILPYFPHSFKRFFAFSAHRVAFGNFFGQQMGAGDIFNDFISFYSFKKHTLNIDFWFLCDIIIM